MDSASWAPFSLYVCLFSPSTEWPPLPPDSSVSYTHAHKGWSGPISLIAPYSSTHCHLSLPSLFWTAHLFRSHNTCFTPDMPLSPVNKYIAKFLNILIWSSVLQCDFNPFIFMVIADVFELIFFYHFIYFVYWLFIDLKKNLFLISAWLRYFPLSPCLCGSPRLFSGLSVVTLNILMYILRYKFFQQSLKLFSNSVLFLCLIQTLECLFTHFKPTSNSLSSSRDFIFTHYPRHSDQL